MAKHTQQRPMGAVVLRPPVVPLAGGQQLIDALREDARELIAALRLRSGADLPPQPEAIAAVQGPLLLLFGDVPASPPLAVEAAADAMAHFDMAIGPCADGAVYLLALAADLEPELRLEIAQAAMAPDAVAQLTDLCDDAELEVLMLPPWFRAANKEGLSFAESLARLSLMSEDGEEDFVADRLRVWLESHAEP